MKTFRSLRSHNFRLWALGAFVSNIGTWMQRIAQDWVVLTELTDQSATAMGIVLGLQFGPQILLLPVSGYVADHYDRRRLLLATQLISAALALGLGLLILTGAVQLWQVYLFAFLLGCVSALEAPARQSFVGELVDDAHLSNAVALNSSSFHTGRLIGPAIAGVMITAVGSGWVFLINALTFLPVVATLLLLRRSELQQRDRPPHSRGSFMEGFRYVWGRPDLMAVLLMLFLIGTFGNNFPIYISTMAVTVFETGASQFGFLSSMMAIGSVIGALMSATRERPRFGLLLAGALVFGVGLSVAALMPTYAGFAVVLVLIGLSAQTFSTTAFGAAQLWTDAKMRGRVMAIVMAITMGGTPIGAPLVGWVADSFGARWALAVGALSGLGAAGVAVRYLVRYRGLRVFMEGGRIRYRYDKA
ncbi:MAG: hypothetical protein RLZZ385_115 [Pseudomonadota bacterium]|jgi:MFS family permease